MKLKKFMALLLVGAMSTAMFAGCGSSADEDEVQPPEVEAADNTETAEEAELSEVGEEIASFEGFDDLQTVSMYVMSFYGDAGAAEVQDAINEISTEAINVAVEYHPLDMATYMQQVGLMLAGGEAMDLVQLTPIPVVSFATLTSQNQLMDIAPYLDEYAPEMKAMMAAYLPSTTIDGEILAVPGYRMYAGGAYLCMRKDILEALGLVEEAEAVSSWSEFEAICLKVKEGMPSLDADLQTTAIIGNLDTVGDIITNKYCDMGADSWSECFGYDGLGDSNNMLYLDENGKVANYFRSDSFKAVCERMKTWADEGIIYKDAATSQESSATLFASGVTFAQVISAEYGAEKAKVAEMAKPYVMLKICDIPVQAATSNMWDWGVATTSENPEAAVAFMNLMYTYPEIQNLFTYGIEGRDYEVNEEGEAHLLTDSTLVYMASDFSFGNQFNALPGEGSGATFREDALAFEKTAEISDLIGFVVSTEPIANELTAVANVLNQYKPALVSGFADEGTLDKMNDAMDEAGMQVIIEYYQGLLDEYQAQQ